MSFGLEIIWNSCDIIVQCFLISITKKFYFCSALTVLVKHQEGYLLCENLVPLVCKGVNKKAFTPSVSIDICLLFCCDIAVFVLAKLFNIEGDVSDIARFFSCFVYSTK